MKKVNKDEETPDEINFTGGIRGKYASRYRKGVSIRETQPDPIALYETQSRLGNALWQAQTLEAVFVAYLSLVREMAVHEAGLRAHELLEHHLSQTVLTDAWPSMLGSKELGDRLSKLVAERNWIMHRCSFEFEKAVDSPERRHDVSVRLSEFADEASYLSQCLIGYIEVKLSHGGLSPAEIESRTKRVIDDWARVRPG